MNIDIGSKKNNEQTNQHSGPTIRRATCFRVFKKQKHPRNMEMLVHDLQ